MKEHMIEMMEGHRGDSEETERIEENKKEGKNGD